MQELKGKAIKNQTVDIDTKAIRKSGVIPDGNLTNWLYVHWETLKDFIRRITGINNVIRVKAVFTTDINLTASGTSVDGYTLLNGDTVLVAGQTNTAENGLYTWATSGALTRLAPFTPTFAAGLSVLNIALQGRTFHVLNGNIHRDTFWYFDSPTQFPVIGTSSLLFYNISNLKLSTVANNLIVQGTDGIEVKLKNTGTVNGGADAVFGGLQYDAVTKEFYIITSLLPGATGSLTVELIGTLIGIASKMNFSKDFKIVWDGANSRANVELNPNRASLPQVGGYMEAFENPNIAVSEPIATTPAIIRLNGLSNSLGSASWQQIYSDKVVNFGRLTSNPNSPFGGVLGYYSPQFFRVVTNFNHYTKSRLRVTTFANNHQIAVFGYFENLFSFGNTPNNAVYFRGKPNENSGRWQCICSNGGVATTVNLGASYTVLGSAFENFEIRIISSQALFYIDDVLVATITTNLPPSSLSLALLVGLAKTTTQTATAGDVMDVGYMGYATEII